MAILETGIMSQVSKNGDEKMFLLRVIWLYVYTYFSNLILVDLYTCLCFRVVQIRSCLPASPEGTF